MKKSVIDYGIGSLLYILALAFSLAPFLLGLYEIRQNLSYISFAIFIILATTINLPTGIIKIFNPSRIFPFIAIIGMALFACPIILGFQGFNSRLFYFSIGSFIILLSGIYFTHKKYFPNFLTSEVSLKRAGQTSSFILRAIAAIVMLQTLYFKISGAPLPVYIFTALGAEPYGRYATAALELVAGIALLIPLTSVYGALLTVGLMSGAILGHIFILGISVMNDDGELFAMACVVMLCALLALLIEKQSLRKLK